jgi:hypothetical protein
LHLGLYVSIILPIMAKNITPEIMETILTKVMEKFVDTFQAALAKLMVSLNDGVNNKLADISVRLDVIEAKMTLQPPPMPAHSETLTAERDSFSASSSVAIAEAASRMLISVEREKEEIRQRARNVIVSGLAPSNDHTDVELLESVCEQYLTVKPHILRVRRIGKDKTSLSSKLCATLDSSDAVDDIIESSRMLRHSEDASVRRIYFNRDLTKQQADDAYKRRLEKRGQRNLPTSNAVGLNPAAPPFQAESC